MTDCEYQNRDAVKRAGRRPRVLVIAEAANPEWVSVPFVGWQHVRALAEVADVHLVTQVRNAPAIARFGLDPGSFTAVDSEAIASSMHRATVLLRGGDGKGWTTGMALSLASYLYFEELVWQMFGEDIRSGRFDLVHRVTPLSPTLPSTIAARSDRAGVPFILGPLNGGVPWPRWFDRERRREREWLSYLRSAYRLVPGHRSMLRHTAALIIGSTATLGQVPLCYRSKCVLIAENAVNLERFSRPHRRAPAQPLRLVFAGRLVAYKGADMLIEAAAPLVQAGRVTVSLIGDGPERTDLERLIRRCGVEGGVTLLGWLGQDQMIRELSNADLFVFPSIREFGGAVVLEAMALGVPPVVVDYGGPSDLVSSSTGFKVPIGPRDAIIAGFRAVIQRVASDPATLAEVARAGRARVERFFTWEAKARQVRCVYDWVLAGAQPPPPEFGAFERSPIPAAAYGGAPA
jgi:glycosyltransferase involved in cell wall biosynthesis